MSFKSTDGAADAPQIVIELLSCSPAELVLGLIYRSLRYILQHNLESLVRTPFNFYAATGTFLANEATSRVFVQYIKAVAGGNPTMGSAQLPDNPRLTSTALLL